MRFLLTALFCLVIAFVIKEDLQQGTLPLTSFYNNEKICEEVIMKSVVIRVVEGDSIYSIFAVTPSPVEVSFPERLASFYKLNPHLQLQSLKVGEEISIPIFEKTPNNC